MNNQTLISDLEPVSRSREFNIYKENLKDKIVYEYLFNAKSHRNLDDTILGLNSIESRGYQSMAILHYLGLKSQHKGVFHGLEIEDAINRMKVISEDKFSVIIQSLKRYNRENTYHSRSNFDNDNEKYFEGEEVYRLHKLKERDSKLVKKAKELFLKRYGTLFCEACKKNFEEVYGTRGEGFIEAHHTKPISEMKDGETTRVEDLAMLCSNCHQMIHRKPFITVNQLKEILKKNHGEDCG